MALSVPRSGLQPGLLLAVCLAHAALLWWLGRTAAVQPPARPVIVPRVVGRLVAEAAVMAPPAAAPRPAPARQQPRPLAPAFPQHPQTAHPRPDRSPTPQIPAATAPAAVSPTAAATQNEAGPRGEEGPLQLPLSRASGLDNPLPVYPELSRRLGEEGVVRLSVMILADGRVAEVSVAKSSGFARLDAAAVAAVRRWHYQAARRNGVAIAWRHTQPVAFSLND